MRSLPGFFVYLSFANTTCHFADINRKWGEKKRGRESGVKEGEKGREMEGERWREWECGPPYSEAGEFAVKEMLCFMNNTHTHTHTNKIVCRS